MLTHPFLRAIGKQMFPLIKSDKKEELILATLVKCTFE